MKALLRYISRRLIFVIPQLIGIVFISFVMLKLIPGDPALLMLGPFADEARIAQVHAELGLDKSFFEQFFIYIKNLSSWNLGTSWQTTRPVTEDLAKRFPATLELVVFGLLLALVIGIPIGALAAYFKKSITKKFSDFYGLLAGSLPDFWLAMVLIYIFYTELGVSAAPIGRIDIILSAPKNYTGFYILDSLFTGNWETLSSAFSHLVLPVITLGVIAAGPILKMTQATMERTLESDFIRYADSCGLPQRVVMRKAFVNSLPSVITIISVLFGFLIGGAVLVEIVFSWGGAGQYAVNGVLNSDIYPVLGFVLYSAILSLIVYLIVDILYFLIDPRIRN